MPPKKNATPAKQLEDSSVTFDESEDMSFRLSRVEGLVKGLVSKGELDQSINKLRGDLEKNMKGSVKIGDLTNLQEEMAENMGNREKKMEKLEESMETNKGEYGEKNGEVGGKYGNNC